MKRTVIRYKTKPDMADRNAELVAAVFAELKAARPEGLRYLSLRLEDDTFIHFVETAAEDRESGLAAQGAAVRDQSVGKRPGIAQALAHLDGTFRVRDRLLHRAARHKEARELCDRPPELDALLAAKHIDSKTSFGLGPKQDC